MGVKRSGGKQFKDMTRTDYIICGSQRKIKLRGPLFKND